MLPNCSIGKRHSVPILTFRLIKPPRYTLDVSTDFLLGRSVGSLKTGSLEFAHAFGEIQRLQNNIARAG